MSENTILKFRPCVEYLGENKNTLRLRVDDKTVNYNFNVQNEFEFKKLKGGTHINNVPKEIINFLENNSLCELFEIDNVSNSLNTEDYLLSDLNTQFRDSVSIASAHAKLNSHYISVINLTHYELSTDWIKDLGAKVKISNNVDESGSDSLAIDVVICNDYSDPRIKEINKIYTKMKKKWLLVNFGSSNTIGPFFNPTSGHGCYECFYKRIQSNSLSEEEISFRKPFNSSLLNTLNQHLLLLQIIRILLTGTEAYERSILTYNAVNMKSNIQNYLPYPICEGC